VDCLRVSATSPEQLAKLMMGGIASPEPVVKAEDSQATAARSAAAPVLEIRDLRVRGDNGLAAVNGFNVKLRAGEILGIAGISGNGQRELLQALGGQRPIDSGEVLVSGARFHGRRAEIAASGFLTLPEEPLQNATVPSMSVAENLALRTFDRRPIASGGFFLDRAAIQRAADAAVQEYSIRPPWPALSIRSLSGGNVQRAVLARELGGGETKILAVANPCFGLDFAATAFVHNRLVDLRNRGGSVLLVSEDLEELLSLSDRILVMSGGRIVHETDRDSADVHAIGRYMGGHGSA